LLGGLFVDKQQERTNKSSYKQRTTRENKQQALRQQKQENNKQQKSPRPEGGPPIFF
jgi:hypothetical protein